MPPEKQMTLLQHIQELRVRLFRVIIGWIAATLLATLFTKPVLAWLIIPLGDSSPYVLGPIDAPAIYFKVAFTMGLGLALPYILYELYKFIAPGLYEQEKKGFIIAIPAVFVLFIAGALFALQVLIPLSLPVLSAFLSDIVEPIYTLDNYLSFVTTIALWMGLLFQTPLVIYMITRLGLVTPKQLTKARKLVIFLAALLAAVITPTLDMVTMLMVTIPFIILYEIGILLAHIAIKQRRRHTDNEKTAADNSK